ncbi:MAG TPA: ABC transporter ATP-binding protein [Actinomycetota bacterium]|nr:ABC transporter ATP-binding protein [Actinomycetota bacterium]
MLVVRDLTAAYGDLQALWGVDLEVREGEWVTMLGPAGAGKTTFMRTVAGAMPATGGTVTLNGLSLAEVPVHERVELGIALVPEGRRLFAGMTVTENLVAGAFARRSRDGIRGHLERVFDLFPALADRRRQQVGTLSGGEQQMCAIGRALMSRPTLLLVDEPSLGLAPMLADRVLEGLDAIRSEGTTLLLVEQDVQAGLEHADRGYVLRQGRIVLAGSSEELMADPDFQETFLGY